MSGEARLFLTVSEPPRGSRAFWKLLPLYSSPRQAFVPGSPVPSARLSPNHSPSPVLLTYPLTPSESVKSCLTLCVWSGWYSPTFPETPTCAPRPPRVTRQTVGKAPGQGHLALYWQT